MSPAPRAVRDVELPALEHVRPVEPGKQLRLQEPHAAAGNARVEREARRHLAAIGELGEHDLAIGKGVGAGPVAVNRLSAAARLSLRRADWRPRSAPVCARPPQSWRWSWKPHLPEQRYWDSEHDAGWQDQPQSSRRRSRADVP